MFLFSQKEGEIPLPSATHAILLPLPPSRHRCIACTRSARSVIPHVQTDRAGSPRLKDCAAPTNSVAPDCRAVLGAVGATLGDFLQLSFLLLLLLSPAHCLGARRHDRTRQTRHPDKPKRRGHAARLGSARFRVFQSWVRACARCSCLRCAGVSIYTSL